MSARETVEVEGVRFTHPAAAGAAPFSLVIPRLHVARGEHVACIGASGTGKTTLVHLIAGILVPACGRVWVAGFEMSAAGEAQRRKRRIEGIGMVFQEFALLAWATALENVLLPYMLSPHLECTRQVKARARSLAADLGIEKLLGRLPTRLSQGERQRVALCRALLGEPALLLCDEATANLDQESAGTAIDLLLDQASRTGASVLAVTHDPSLLGRFDRVIDMETLNRQGAAHGELAPR